MEIVWNEVIAQPDPDEAPVSMQGRRPEVYAGEKNGTEVYGATPSVAGLRPARTNSTIWRRNSGAYGGLDLGMVDTSSPKGQVSTNSDQLHTVVRSTLGQSAIMGLAMTFQSASDTECSHTNRSGGVTSVYSTR